MFKLYITSRTLYKSAKHCNISRLRSMATVADDVIIENIKGKGVMTLNRPKALNALNLSMVKKIVPTLEKWEREKSFVILKGAGEKSFCAGGDVKAIVEANMSGEKLGEEFFRWEYFMNGLIGNYEPPYIALIDGITMGGGVGLSVHGRYRVATERTLFAMPETQIGLFPDVGGSHFLPRLSGRLGLFLALTGYRLKGIDNLAAGIATHYIESAKLNDLEKDLLENCYNDKEIKAVLEKYNTKEKYSFSLCDQIDKIDHCFSAPTVEEIIQRLEEDGSDWAKNTLKTLKKMSPTSMKVTKALLDKTISENLSLEQCLTLEYRIACHTLSRTEFNEGVRALLIDKDQNPNWNPAKLEDVTDDIVNSHFKPLASKQELKWTKPSKL